MARDASRRGKVVIVDKETSDRSSDVRGDEILIIYPNDTKGADLDDIINSAARLILAMRGEATEEKT